MPSILPGYEYDIFISYRHNDNRSGWVTEFVSALQEDLAATIKEPLSIYFDKNPHDGLLETHNVDKSLEGKLKCLIFIPIISQTYCDPKSFAWHHEFCAFNNLAQQDAIGRNIKLTNGNVASRILPVKIHDLDTADITLLENELGYALRAMEFIYKEAGVNRPLLYEDNKEDNQNKTVYRNQVNKVANAVKEILNGLSNPGSEIAFKKIKPQDDISHINPKKSIAVLPFVNISSDPGQEYFSDGLTEEVINSLSKLKELSVISRSSAMTFKASMKTLKEIAAELRVRYLLEGSVRKSINDFRITAQLIDGETDSHVWSEKYSGVIGNIFDVQENLSRSIVSALEVQLNTTEDKNLTHRPIQDVRAFDCYLKAKQQLSVPTKESLLMAIQSLKEGLSMTGDNELFYGTLTYVFYELWVNGYCQAEEFKKEIEICVEKTTRLNADSASSFLAKGVKTYMEGKRQEAAFNFKRVLLIEPENILIQRLLGVLYLDVGRPELAAPLLRNVLALDPLLAYNQGMVGYLEWQQGRFKIALPYWQRAYELEPETPPLTWSYACALASAGLKEQAIAHVDKMPENLLATIFGRMSQFLAQALQGNHQAAIATVNDELLSAAKAIPFVSRDLAGYYSLVGEMDEAIKWLENALNLGYINYPFLAFHHPFFGALRNDSRFIDLMNQIKPRWEEFID